MAVKCPAMASVVTMGTRYLGQIQPSIIPTTNNIYGTFRSYAIPWTISLPTAAAAIEK